MELATLKGTEKQLNWAKAIRKDRLKVWQAADPDGFRSAESMLTQQSYASWWITCRDMSLVEACSKLQGGARPKTAKPETKTATPGVTLKVAAMEWADNAELWETVVTATGFTRSGPTRDMATGEVVHDATLPF
jgi:hypothetical protein